MSDRPSRQDLVVVPKRVNLPVVIGAIACACAGFGVVLTFGIGRSSPRPSMDTADTVRVVPVESAFQTSLESSAEPDRISPPDDENSTVSQRGWHAPAATTERSQSSSRYPISPASLDAPEGIETAAENSAVYSRFSGSAAATPQTAQPDPEQGAPKPEAMPPNTLPEEGDELAPAIPAVAVEATVRPTHLASAATDREPTASVASPVAAAMPSPPQAPVASAPPGPLPSAPTAPVPPMPATLPALIPSQDRYASANTSLPVTANPLRAAAPQPTTPFAAAPPLTSSADLIGSDNAASRTQTGAANGGAATGHGRPGPLQLEGLQTPQVALEKRGPREVQVGKSARYEIFVRNVGTATAHDVALRDSVPYGTSLIATTPPASPATQTGGIGATGDLVWLLGSLPPGGQSRVTIEVMPTVEGDVGSVASVSFRADASVRSRATKPDLRIDAAPPQPVLVGRDVQLSIRITNPGTGVATGVVLEGLLPEGVTHQSGRELEYDIGQLQPGESRTIDLSLASTSPGVHATQLTARADGQIEVVHPVRIEVTAPTLELSADIPSRRYLQRPATCILSMTNAGTAPAKSVELVAQLPPGMKFMRANNAGYYEERTHRVLWNLEELPAAETGTVEVVVMPIDLGPQKIVAAARTANGLSDQVAHTVEVEGLAAIFFEVTDSEDPIEVNGLTEYVVRVGNQGTKAASGVRLTATLLGDLEPLEASGPAAHRIENLTVVFEPLAKLAPSEEAVFRVRVKGRREGDQRVQVQLTSDENPSPLTKEEITRVYSDR